MKNKITRKDFFMEIKKSPGRFISIFFIVAMGVAFFSGIRSSEPDMRLTGDNYFDQTHLMDIKCVSTMGLTDDDIEAISRVKGVEYVEGSCSRDFLELRDDQEKVVHVMALNEKLNIPAVTEGRLPEKVGECLVDDEEGYQVGDQIILKSGSDDEVTDSLKVDKLTIVGTGSSPCYISFNRGNTNIGNGSVAAFVLVPAETFDMDVYTEAYIQVEDALAQTTYTDAYQNLIDYVMDEIDKITVERSRIRRQEIVDEAQKELDEGRQELADAKKEADEKLADGKKELDDAKQQLADGKKELDDGKKELDAAANQLVTGRQELADAKKEIDSGKKELADGKKELDAAKQEIADGEKQLSDAKKEVANGKKELDQGRDQLNQSQKEIDDGKAEVASGKTELEAGKAAYDAAYAEFLTQKETAEKEMEEGQAQLAQAQQIFDAAWSAYQKFEERLESLKEEEPDPEDPDYDQWQMRVSLLEQGLPEAKRLLDYAQGEFDKQKADAEAQIEEGKAQLQAAEDEFARQKQIIEENEKQLEAAAKQLEEGQKQIDAGWQEITANEELLNQAEEVIATNEKDLEEGKKDYQKGKEEYNKGVKELEKGEKQYQEGVAQLADGEKKYRDGVAEWNKGVKEYEDGVREYEDGVKEYEKKKKEAEEKIADAEAELADAEAKIAEIETPKWYVYDRGSLPEHSGYGENADRMKALGKVFPLIFFLVAALISLTNMTRMVEEQRINIGTMKALGYGRNEIAGKYLGYALLATISGSILGVLLGEKLFPFIIVYSYGIMYHHIPEVMVPYNMYYGVLASLFAIATITIATLASCYSELRETPAVLMRPPAPKSGKRTILERIPFVWNLLNFSWKSTIRNLLRYKKRFFMTIFGIGGCMGLMVFGYGLKDSIFEITQLQYTDIQVYKGMIYLQDDYSHREMDDFYTFMDEDEEVSDYMDAYMKNITLVNGKRERSAVEMVMMDESKIPDYVHFRDRVSGEKYELTDDGVIISEKTAKLLNAGIGDTIQIRDEDAGNMDVVIRDITENYMGHYMYLSPAYFKKVHGEQPEINTVLFMAQDGASNEQIEKIGLQIMKQDAVLSIGYMHDIQQTLDKMLSTLNLVIIVLIISAGLLAFVVLYNLNEVNITERRRELATLKVLGFHDSEVDSYVFRENVVLTVIGVMVGCIFGKLLHEFTISTVEVDAAMFGRIITTKSYIYSMLFTILFSMVINVVMHFKLKKIDMVESLKSIE